MVHWLIILQLGGGTGKSKATLKSMSVVLPSSDIMNPIISSQEAVSSRATTIPEAKQQATETTIISPELTKPNDESGGVTIYVNAKALTAQPSTSEDIQLDPPEGFPAEYAGTVKVFLWISRTGIVDLVKVDGSFLLPRHREYISRQFAHAHFHPGEIDELPVASFIEIEIKIRPESDGSITPTPSARETTLPQSSHALPQE